MEDNFNLTNLRRFLGLTQTKVAKAFVTFQQIQKYEKGK